MTVGPTIKVAATTVSAMAPMDEEDEMAWTATSRPPPQWVENASCYSPVLLDDPTGGSHLLTGATPVTAFKARTGFIFEMFAK